MKLNQKLNWDKAESKFSKIKTKPTHKNAELLFEFLYTKESLHKFNKRKILYPQNVGIDSLEHGVQAIDSILSIWKTGSVNIIKMNDKYFLNEEKLLDIQSFFKGRIRSYNDSINNYRKTLEQLKQDSLLDVYRIDVPRTLINCSNDFNIDTLNSILGNELTRTLDVAYTISSHGVDKVYEFTLSFARAYFERGAYKKKQTDYALLKTFEHLKNDIFDYDFIMTISGTADASKPRSIKYMAGSELWGDIKNATYRSEQSSDTLMNIKINNSLSNLQIAFFRGYNAQRLFQKVVKKDIDELQVIDYLNTEEKRKGDEYRTVSYIMIINDYYAEIWDQFSAETIEKIKNEGDHFYKLILKDGKLDLDQGTIKINYMN